MTKRTGTIITIVVAVLTLCCSASCCLFGGLFATGQGEWTTDVGGLDTGQIDPVFGIPLICLGILAWVVPVLLWVFLVRRKNGEATATNMAV